MWLIFFDNFVMNPKNQETFLHFQRQSLNNINFKALRSSINKELMVSHTSASPLISLQSLRFAPKLIKLIRAQISQARMHIKLIIIFLNPFPDGLFSLLKISKFIQPQKFLLHCSHPLMQMMCLTFQRLHIILLHIFLRLLHVVLASGQKNK